MSDATLGDRRPSDLTLAAGIAVAAALAYAVSLGGGFVFDDHLLVEGSPLLRGPLWRVWFSRDPVDYWPLTTTTFWIEHRLWGEAALGFRLVNLGLHAAAAILLWRVLARLRVRGAWLAGLLFAVHPVAVESVAWISERKNTLSGALCLGAALVWLRYRDTGRDRLAAAAAALFAAALLAKTSVVMLPVVLLGVRVLDRRARPRHEAAWLAALFALALASGLLTIWFQWSRSMGGVDLARPLAERVGGAAWAWLWYLYTAFQPFAADVVHAGWPVEPGSPLYWAPAVALAALGAASAAAWRRTRAPALALAVHGLLVLPVLGLLDMGFLLFSPVGNHLQYLALAGPLALVGVLAARAAAALRGRVVIVAAAAVVLALAAQTARRASAYRDDVALWTRAVAEAPQSLTAARLLAGALVEAGRPRDALAALDAAARRLEDPAASLRARALLLAQVDREEEASALERQATALRRDLGFQYELGVILNRYGHPALAEPLLRELVHLQPRSGSNRYQLGSALAKLGRLPEALAELRVGCGLAPGSDSCTALVLVLRRQGMGDAARSELAAAMRADPSGSEVDAVLRRAAPGGAR